MPQNAFFLQILDLLVSQKMTQRLFSMATVLHLYCFAILGLTSTVIHSVKQRLLRNWPGSVQRPLATSCAKDYNLSRLLARKSTKCIHSSKPASLHRPIAACCNKGSWVEQTWTKEKETPTLCSPFLDLVNSQFLSPATKMQQYIRNDSKLPNATANTYQTQYDQNPNITQH